MAVLGIVLIVLAVLFGLGVLVTSGASTTMEVFGADFGVSVPTVFVLGALAGATLILGLWLTKKGLGRGYRRRKEMRELRAQATSTTTPEITESDTAEEVATDRDQTLADDEPATRPDTVTDPNSTKQPH
jgi:hypothetical protein